MVRDAKIPLSQDRVAVMADSSFGWELAVIPSGTRGPSSDTLERLTRLLQGRFTAVRIMFTLMSK